MPLDPGTRLGSYHVVSVLGAGGMGEVYRARDERLGREVAIKILPASVAHDPERLGRFEREAKLLGSLSHPNIATLYALEQFDGRGVLVMELAPGEDLTSRIDRAAMALDEILPIAVQIALALEAAHDKGIVHRDLKPANIKIAPDGGVKVLDFGLAKAFEPDDPSSPSAMQSPTLTAQATQAGIILGTAAYMSPEQARGRAADKRADIWSFGVVLFEMLTGARQFAGDTVSDTLAAVLRQEIDWTQLPPATPAALRQLLKRCLERDRRNRLHDIADARIVLEEIVRDGGGASTAASVAPVQVRRGVPVWLTAGSVAAALLGGAAGGWFLSPRPAAATPGAIVKFAVSAPAGVSRLGNPALPLDGSFVVFEGSSGQQTRLYLQRLDEVAPHAIDKTEGAESPFVSPDGRWIGFWRSGRLEKMPSEGGDPLTVVEQQHYAPGASWGPSGTIVYSQAWLGGLASVPAGGGKIQVLTTPDLAAGEKGHWWPQFLPNGRGVLFTIFRAASGLNDGQVAVLDLSTNKYRALLPGANAFFVPPGYLVFYRAGAYHAVRFDLASMTISGEPVRVLDEARGLAPEGDSTLSFAAAAGSGAIVYRPGQRFPDQQLAWVSADGRLSRLPFAAHAITGGDLSSDGTRLAVEVLDAGRYVIRVLDLTRGTDDLLDMPGSNQGPVWHPDGRRLAFYSMRKGDFDLYLKDTASTAPPVGILTTDRDESPESWTPDGKLIYQESQSDGQYWFKIIDISQPASGRTLIDKTARGAVSSPDGRWLLYEATGSGRAEVYVKPIEGDAAAERITANGGSGAVWSRRTPEVFYARGSELIAAGYRTEGDRFRVTGERVVFKTPELDEETIRTFNLAPDNRVLIRVPLAVPVSTQLRVVINWSQEIERRLVGK